MQLYGNHQLISVCSMLWYHHLLMLLPNPNSYLFLGNQSNSLLGVVLMTVCPVGHSEDTIGGSIDQQLTEVIGPNWRQQVGVPIPPSKVEVKYDHSVMWPIVLRDEKEYLDSRMSLCHFHAAFIALSH
jgi:hypothetical protein